MRNHRSAYAAPFELRPGRTGWLLVRDAGDELKRIPEPSDWLMEQTIAWNSVNSVRTRAIAIATWWRWCIDTGHDPLKVVATDFARFLLALQSVPKEMPLTSVVRALPGDERLRAASTVSQMVNHIKAFYAWAWTNGRVAVVTGRQMANFKTPRVPVSKRAERLQPSQVTILFGLELHPRDRLALEMLYGAGLREGEALGTRVQDMHVNQMVADVFGCDLKAGPHLHVVRRLNSNGALAKSQYERIVPLSYRVLNAYNNWQNYLYDHMQDVADSGYLLLSLSGPTRGRPWSVSGFKSMWTRHIKAIPELKKSHPHVLRHTFASELTDAGVNPHVIQELLGHRNPNSTNIYTHPQVESMTAAANQLDKWRANKFRGNAHEIR